MNRLEDARSRAILTLKIIQARQDVAIRLIIESYPDKLDYSNSLEDLAIAPDAWRHVTDNSIDPKLVFAHPVLLRTRPNTSSSLPRNLDSVAQENPADHRFR